MKCPHCAVSIHESWNVIQEPNGWFLRLMKCPECKDDIVCVQRITNEQRYLDDDLWIQAYPTGSSRGPVPPEVPHSIAADYDEAALVLRYSPKASAALSRRCVQAVLREAGYTQRDLSVQINAVLCEKDPIKAIPSGLRVTVDLIRNFGNFAAHVINDQTTLQIIDVEDHEAEFCLDVLESLFDHYYVKPAEAERRKTELDAKLKAAGKPASKR